MATAPHTRVVMIIIDAMPHRYVSADLTPNLWRQVLAGGRAPMGATSLPVSVTYANHAAFVTGADPAQTGIYGNHTWIDGEGWVRAPKAGPRAPTVFTRLADAGGTSVLIVGDHKLVAQMGGDAADVVWPPDGWIPDGTKRCEFGYPADAAVVGAARAASLDADFVVLHLNQPDTTSHLYGPDSAEALAQYRATDEAYGMLIDELADRWPDTILITVSDHDQEPVSDLTPIELIAPLAGFTHLDVVHDGTAALVHGPLDRPERRAIRAVHGVESLEPIGPNVWMVWTDPGRSFGETSIPIRGQHGSPRCRTQLAVVSGGHKRVAELVRRVENEPVSVLDWAPLIANALGLAPLP